MLAGNKLIIITIIFEVPIGIVRPIAGVLYAAVLGIVKLVLKIEE